METKTENTPWRPRRSTTRKEIVTRLQIVQVFASENVVPGKNVEYYRFFGFIEGLKYMHIFNKAQHSALVQLALRAAGVYSDPLPEGEALNNAVADIMAGRLPE